MDVLIGTSGGVFDGTGSRLLGDPVAHVARRGDDWWAIGDRGLVRNGETVAPPPPGTTLNCVLPTAHSVWVGADRARLFYLEEGTLTEDEDFAGAPGRDGWHTPWGGPPDVRSMAGGRDESIYINVHVGGILRFDNTGFVPTVDIHVDVHQVAVHPDRPGVVVAATARGLAVSSDGQDFEFRTDGLAHPYCRAVATYDDTVVISASRGPRGGDARLYRGGLDGGELEPCPGLAPFDGNLDSHCVVAGREALLVGHGSTVWASTDGGDTWEVAVDRLPAISSIA